MASTAAVMGSDIDDSKEEPLIRTSTPLKHLPRNTHCYTSKDLHCYTTSNIELASMTANMGSDISEVESVKVTTPCSHPGFSHTGFRHNEDRPSSNQSQPFTWKTFYLQRSGNSGYGLSMNGFGPAQVYKVASGSVAEEMGVRAGDLVMGVSGQGVGSYTAQTVARIMRYYPQGVSLLVYRYQG